MPNNTDKLIESITVFRCGYCQSNLKSIFKNSSDKILKFPALVILIKHKIKGYILYDTGYSRSIYQGGIISKIYNKILPVFCNRQDELIFKLKNKGIDVNQIGLTILSHLHPDHIGGVKFLKNSKFIISSSAYKKYKSNFKIFNLIFSHLLTKKFKNSIVILGRKFKTTLLTYFDNAYDIFDDGSIYLIPFNGHAKEQICVYIPEKNVFLASDICWGTDFINKTSNMKLLPRLMQNNFYEYKKNILFVKKLMAKKIKVIFSHDNIKDGWEIH